MLGYFCIVVLKAVWKKIEIIERDIVFSVTFIAKRVIDSGKRTRCRQCSASRGLLFTAQIAQKMELNDILRESIL